MLICPIDGTEFQPYSDMRYSASGLPWCKKCQDEHDAIDWEEVYRKQREEW